MFLSFIEKLQEELGKDLPGFESQIKMAPPFRPMSNPDETTRQASVLILLFPKGKEIETVFIRRPEYDGAHGGQISFPGGKVDQTDKDRIETALRETEEEIGVKRDCVQVIGTLTPLFIPVSNIEVLPVIGFTNEQPDFFPDKEEVAYTLTGSIQKLRQPQNKDISTIKVQNMTIETPVYKIAPTEKIWGATAMMLSEFFDILHKMYCN